MAFQKKNRDAIRRVLEVLAFIPDGVQSLIPESRMDMTVEIYDALEGAKDPQLALLVAIALNGPIQSKEGEME